jgi:hypothetical protein
VSTPISLLTWTAGKEGDVHVTFVGVLLAVSNAPLAQLAPMVTGEEYVGGVEQTTYSLLVKEGDVNAIISSMPTMRGAPTIAEVDGDDVSSLGWERRAGGG